MPYGGSKQWSGNDSDLSEHHPILTSLQRLAEFDGGGRRGGRAALRGDLAIGDLQLRLFGANRGEKIDEMAYP